MEGCLAVPCCLLAEIAVIDAPRRARLVKWCFHPEHLVDRGGNEGWRFTHSLNLCHSVWSDGGKTTQITAIQKKSFPVGSLDSAHGRHNRPRNAIMRRLLAAALVLTSVVGSTSSFARGGLAHGSGGGFRRDPTLLGPAPQIPTFESRIPAPLPPPAQAPIINGPVSQPALR
jgi:hypothetical protein